MEEQLLIGKVTIFVLEQDIALVFPALLLIEVLSEISQQLWYLLTCLIDLLCSWWHLLALKQNCSLHVVQFRSNGLSTWISIHLGNPCCTRSFSDIISWTIHYYTLMFITHRKKKQLDSWAWMGKLTGVVYGVKGVKSVRHSSLIPDGNLGHFTCNNVEITKIK